MSEISMRVERYGLMITEDEERLLRSQANTVPIRSLRAAVEDAHIILIGDCVMTLIFAAGMLWALPSVYEAVWDFISAAALIGITAWECTSAGTAHKVHNIYKSILELRLKTGS